MNIPEKIMNIRADKKMMTAVVILGTAGLLLIMLSSLMPDKKKSEPKSEAAAVSELEAAESYREETEKRLGEFLSAINGAGEVKVYLKVGSGERYVYAAEGRQSKNDNKTEEERKYVMIGGGSDRAALIETVKAPVIEGAVIVFSGSREPAVMEQLYRAAAAALGISTGKIYVAEGNTSYSGH